MLSNAINYQSMQECGLILKINELILILEHNIIHE